MLTDGNISVLDGRFSVNAVVTDPVTIAYHELRSPLGLVATAARSVAADCADEELRARCLSIVRAAERMLRTAGRLLEVAETSKGQDVRDFDPAGVLFEVLADYRALGVPVSVEVEEPLRAGVRGVPEHFEALLCSILGNATDHGADGEPILVSISADDRCFRATIVNSVAAARSHMGIGLGSYIGERLANHLSASLRVERSGDRFIAELALPLAS